MSFAFSRRGPLDIFPPDKSSTREHGRIYRTLWNNILAFGC